MKEKSITDRLVFLAEQFDVFETDSEETPIDVKIGELEKDGFEVSKIEAYDNKVIALLSKKLNDKQRTIKKVSISDEVFGEMISSDPTENKTYTQWMLNVFSRLIKSDNKYDVESAIRFASEDLPQANVYLVLFENNKRKKTFKELCLNSYGLKNIADPTNINQYKSLAQLFDAVDPFIEREPSAVERTMLKFVESGQAEIPVRDRRFTLFIPKTTAANVIFDKFTNWCTAKQGNGMFKNYTEGKRKPNNTYSDIYIIIDNKFFTGESKDLYQIHFESRQIKDRTNSTNVKIFEPVLSKSESITQFFYEELMSMAKQNKKGIESNLYLDYLVEFGFSECLFDLYPQDTPAIRIMTREIPKLPDMSRFKFMDQLVITNAGLTELTPSVGNLSNLSMLVLTNNKITKIPKEIGNLKKLTFLNLYGNTIIEIPEEIKFLDKSHGGSLYRLGIDADKIGEENYYKLKKLLPKTIIE